MQLLDALVECEIEMNGVSNLTHLVMLLPRLAKSSWQYDWSWRKISGVLAAVELELKADSLGGFSALSKIAES